MKTYFQDFLDVVLQLFCGYDFFACIDCGTFYTLIVSMEISAVKTHVIQWGITAVFASYERIRGERNAY